MSYYRSSVNKGSQYCTQPYRLISYICVYYISFYFSQWFFKSFPKLLKLIFLHLKNKWRKKKIIKISPSENNFVWFTTTLLTWPGAFLITNGSVSSWCDSYQHNNKMFLIAPVYRVDIASTIVIYFLFGIQIKHNTGLKRNQITWVLTFLWVPLE